WGCACSNDQGVPDKEILAHRYVKERLRRLELRLEVHSFRDTDDLHPFVFHFEALADRIFPRPIFVGHRFIDDRDPRRVLVVGSNKLAAGDQWDSKSGKIILADLKI